MNPTSQDEFAHSISSSIEFESAGVRWKSGSKRIQIGFTSSGQRTETLRWLSRGQRPDAPGRLQAEYPHLFSGDPATVPVTLFIDEKPVAFCLLWAVHFRVRISRFRAGMISLVFTDPEYRRQGFAREIVRAALEEANQLRLGVTMLWSELDTFYRELGFVPAGTESLLLLNTEILDSASEDSSGDSHRYELARPTNQDWTAIERLRESRSCQLEMDRGQIAEMSSTIPELSCWAAYTDGALVGFAMRGRGSDFGEVIHEWGGETSAAIECCRELLREEEVERELLLLAPTDASEELPWKLRQAGAHRIKKPLAWMQITHPASFAEDLTLLLGPPKPLRLRRDARAGQSIILGNGSEELCLSESAVLEAFFGSHDTRAFSIAKERIEPILDREQSAELPLPFFIWGMESI